MALLDDVSAVANDVFEWVGEFMPEGYPRPIWRMEINGKGVGAETASRLISLSVRDCRGFEADQLDVELSDHDGALSFPDEETLIKVWLGFAGQYLEYKGEYKVSEYNHSGAPDRLRITARAADLAAELSEQRDKSWHKTTVFNIVSAIAATHNYEVRISESFKDEAVAHMDQTNESDASFLTRLADQNDAIATIKNGIMLFMKAGECTTVSGKPIPPVLITRASGDGHSFNISKTENFQAVRAYYKTAQEGQRKEVLVNETNVNRTEKEVAQANKPKTKGRRKKGQKKTDTPPPPPIDTGGQKVKNLRHLYASYTNALRGARAAYKKIKRGVAEFKINLAIGRPDLFPEMPAYVSGFKQMIDGQEWLFKGLSHKLDASGLVSEIELEMRLNLDGEGDEDGDDLEP